MSEPFITCENLVKVYQVADLEMVALQGLNITIERGELVGIIGSSGSGKSTLMNVLGGLDRPTAGKVKVDDQDLLKMSDRQLNRYRLEKVGFVWQQSARNLVPYLNAIQNVMLPMTLFGLTGKEKKTRAEELLDLVGLHDRSRHHLPQLSGGEQQRVAIAVALANHPTLLLGDEPTGEVDSTTADIIYDTFQMLTKEIGVTTLIVSHDPEIARHVDRVVGIRDGMLASEVRRQTRQTNGEQAVDEDGNAIEGDVEEVEETFEELVVLDKAGRVHIPHEFLEELGIGHRAQLELTEHGILVKPLAPEDRARLDGIAADDDNESEGDDDEIGRDEPPPKKSGAGKFFQRFRRKPKKAGIAGTDDSGAEAKEEV